MKTSVCEMLGVDVPILAFTHCRDVVAAVTKAGGFGVLGAAGHTPEQLDIDLQWIQDEVGEKPFGVDIIVPAKYEGSSSHESLLGQRMQTFLQLIRAKVSQKQRQHWQQ